MREVEDALTAFQAADTLETLHAEMARLSSLLGYAAVSYIDVRQLPISDEPVPFYQTSLDPGFLQAYLDENLGL